MRCIILYSQAKFIKSQTLFPLVVALFLILGQANVLYNIKKNNCYIQINHNSNSSLAYHPVECAIKLVQESKSFLSVGVINGLPANQAIDYLNKLANEDQNNEGITIQLGQTYWDNDQKDLAIETWEKAEFSDTYLAGKSILEAQNNNLETALLWAEIAHNINPSLEESKEEMYSTLCDSLRNVKRPAEALVWCKRSSQAQKNGWRQIALANVYYDLGRFSDAVDLLNSELEISYPEQIKGLIYLKLGQSYFRLGKFDLSENAFRHAIMFGLVDEVIYTDLIKSLIRQNEMREACLVLENARANGLLIEIDSELSINCQ